MIRIIENQKSTLVFQLLSGLNRQLIKRRFPCIEVEGLENLPGNGSFLMVCNHVSRWDGLLIYSLFNRPANFMVSPDELKGLQGLVLRKMGAFPANPRLRLLSYIRERVLAREGIVIFPEGNVFYDGRTHPFKPGAARLALTLNSEGFELPLVPCAIQYADSKAGPSVRLALSQPFRLSSYLSEFSKARLRAACDLSFAMYREVCHLRENLGAVCDNDVLWTGRLVRSWVQGGSSGYQIAEPQGGRVIGGAVELMAGSAKAGG